MPDFGKLNFSVSFNPTSGFPLDARYTFDSLTAAQEAAASAVPIGSSDGVYYYGENIVVVEDNVATLYLIQPDGTLSALGASEDITQLTSQVTQLQSDLTDLEGVVDGKEDVSNKVTSLSASSTNTQYPSAKVVYDQLALRLTDAPSDGKQYARSDGEWSEVVITTPDLQAVLNEGGTASTGNIELTNANALIAVGAADLTEVGSGSLRLLHNTADVFKVAVSDTGELEVTGADGSNGIFNDWLENDVTGNTATLDGTVLTKAHVGLSNVTNESKATMFTNPTFTGTVTVPTPTAATAAANKQYVDDAIGDIPTANLQAVLDAGNTANSDLRLTGNSILSVEGSNGVIQIYDGTFMIVPADAQSEETFFAISGASGTVEGSEGIKNAFNKWLENSVSGTTAILAGTTLTKSHVGLGNVTNESKTTMFTNPTFTGTVTVPTPTAATAAANKSYVDTAISSIPDPTLNDVVTAGNTITSGTLTTTLSAGTLSFNDTDSSNSFSINVATPAVTGSDEMKSVFTEWLGVGLVYRYSAA